MDNRGEKIRTLLTELISLDSLTGTARERSVEGWLLRQLSAFGPAVEAGSIAVPHDPAGRAAIYAFVRGSRRQTVLFMNHHDVVSTEAYGSLAGLAFSPESLAEELKKIETDAEVQADLASGDWLFGRGACDMKGGLAAQLAVLEEYAEQPDGVTLLFLSVPDEESFSAGMRAALLFLKELKEREKLEYSVLVDCEPNQMENGRLTAFTGSVGKVLPVLFAQGRDVHISRYTEGLNPLGIIARIIAATEGNAALIDTCGIEKTPPPAWVFLRDQKEQYDFSLPKRAAAYGSFLTFQKTPADVLAILQKAASAAIADCRSKTGTAVSMDIITFADLWKKASAQPGFPDFQTELTAQTLQALQDGTMDYPACTLQAIGRTIDFMKLTEPVLVLAFAPPYYPAADSRAMDSPSFAGLTASLEGHFPLRLCRYFTGVSDCSYCGIEKSLDTAAFEANTPLWGQAYSFDLPLLQELQIPFLLLGPWGKDLHERTERVHVGSLCQDLPDILWHIMKTI